LKLNIRTGFYTFKTFIVNFEQDQIDFICGEEIISFLYGGIKDVSVKETSGKKVSLEITDGEKSIDASFADMEDAERFVKELQAKSDGQLRLKFNLRNESRASK
jgi:hypothetical protein